MTAIKGLDDRELKPAAERDAELERLRERLARAFADIDAPRPLAAYAVGGSATSLQRLIGNVSRMMQDRFFACLQTKI